jgi:predicted RNA-binding Zn-ribbon protein involved in translation (DUF1610 family)
MDNTYYLPKNTKAFICANCGAVSLDSDKLCKIQGRGTKADWCGIPHLKTTFKCKNHTSHLRYKCANCNQVATDPQLLCNPVKIKPEK